MHVHCSPLAVLYVLHKVTAGRNLWISGLNMSAETYKGTLHFHMLKTFMHSLICLNLRRPWSGRLMQTAKLKQLPLDWFFPTLGDIITALSLAILRFLATSLMPSTVLRFGCQHKHIIYEVYKQSSSEYCTTTSVQSLVMQHCNGTLKWTNALVTLLP